MSKHLPPEILAGYLENRLDEIHRARVHTHLQCCETCFEAYQYAVRFNAVRIDERPDAMVAPSYLKRQVERLAHSEGRRRRSWLTRPRLAMVPVAAVVLVAAIWWGRPVSSRFDPDSAALVPITIAMNNATARGDIVLPGAVVADTEPMRSGTVPITPELDKALARLADKVAAGTASRDEIGHLVAGYLATGLVDNARGVLRRFADTYRDDPTFLNLRAVVAYNDDNLEEARDLLAASLKLDETAESWLNLGIIYRELGEDDLASQAFDSATSLAPNPGVAARASTLRASLKG